MENKLFQDGVVAYYDTRKIKRSDNAQQISVPIFKNGNVVKWTMKSRNQSTGDQMTAKLESAKKKVTFTETPKAIDNLTYMQQSKIETNVRGAKSVEHESPISVRGRKELEMRSDQSRYVKDGTTQTANINDLKANAQSITNYAQVKDDVGYDDSEGNSGYLASIPNAL
ncbi:hypothetical protein ACOME3_008548 [Neoechinorhynchus agilis]